MEPDEVRQLSLDTRLVERVAAVLERILPWAAWVVRPVLWVALVGLLAAVGLTWILFDAANVDSAVEWLVMLFAAGILLIPAGVLLLFAVFLRQLLELPNQLRAMPGTAREQGTRLAAALGRLRRRDERRPTGLVRGIWGLRGAFLELSGLLEPFLSLAGLIRLPFLVLVMAALIAVGVEVVLLAIALVVVAVV